MKNLIGLVISVALLVVYVMSANKIMWASAHAVTDFFLVTAYIWGAGALILALAFFSRNFVLSLKS